MLIGSNMVQLIAITGKALSGEWGKDDENGDGIPVLRTTNFMNNGTVNYDNVVTRMITKTDVKEKFLRTGDIIIEKSGGSDKQPVGRVVYFEGESEKYLFNNFTGLLRVQDTKKWNPKYVFYVLYANYIRGGTKAYENKTTGLYNLKTDMYVANTIIPYREFFQQCKIVDILDTIWSLIQAKHEQLQAFDDLVKSRFIEMFGDPVENPLDWKLKPLLSMGTCKNGMNFHYDDSGVEIRCLGVGDFKDLSVISDVTSLSMVSLNEMPSDEYLLQNDDIIFVRSNGNRTLVGRSLVVYPENVLTTFSGFCIRYRKFDKSIIIPYLIMVLKTDSMRKKMIGQGANIQNLNQQTLGTLNIPVPPLELQNQFAAFVQQTDKSKLAVKESLEKLETLKKALMQQYFG